MSQPLFCVCPWGMGGGIAAVLAAENDMDSFGKKSLWIVTRSLLSLKQTIHWLISSLIRIQSFSAASAEAAPLAVQSP